MKTFCKINLLSLILGLTFYLLSTLLLEQYDLQQKFGQNVLSFFCMAIFLFTSIIVPLITNKWLNGSKLSFFSSLLWIPYVFIVIKLAGMLFPQITNYHEDDYGAIRIVFLIIVFPFYIFILNLIGILFNKANKQEKYR